MLKYHNNISLKKYNTFGIDVNAKHFYQAETKDDILEFLSLKIDYPLLVLGEGSNILFTKDYTGTILKPEIKGIEIIEETIEHVFIRVGAGENWDSFVSYCVDKGWGGIENLSLIPGSVGSSPVQNIGAYGVEVKDVIFQIAAFDLKSNKDVWYMNSQCKFDYRYSIFKEELKGNILIYEVVFKLDKIPNLHMDYGSISEELKKFDKINMHNLRQSVINIRRSKLPEPEEIGNAGSFFKNPIVKKDFAEDLRKEHNSIPIYPIDDIKSKLAAGWLIDQCNLKGYRQGDAGIHDKQALVLVNHGNATGKEIHELAKHIQQKVYEKFSVILEPEVNIL